MFKILYCTVFIGILFNLGCSNKERSIQKEKDEFIYFYLSLIDTMIVLADKSLAQYNNNGNTTYPCDYMKNQKWLRVISSHLKKYDNIGIFSIGFNPPMLCFSTLAFEEYKLNMSGGDFRIKLFHHVVNSDLELEIYVAGFKKDRANLENFQGVIEISGIKKNHEFIYSGKYDFNATILIPKDFTEWKNKIQSKSIKEVLGESIRI